MDAKPASPRRRKILFSAAAVPVLSTLTWRDAVADDTIPVADFFRPSTIRALRLAPGGKYICGIREVEGRSNAAIFDLAARKSLVITNFRDADVVSLEWVTDDRLAFSLFDRTRGSGDQFGSGLFVIDRDGSKFRPLVERSMVTEGGRQLPVGSTLHSRIFENGKWSDDILVDVPSMQALGRFSSNVYRVSTGTGQSTLLTLGGPGNVVRWVFDRNVVARVALASVDGVGKFYYRDGEDKPWRELFDIKAEDVTKAVTPLAFDAQGHLYVSAYGTEDNLGIYRFNPAAARIEPEPVFAVKGFDVDGGLLFSGDGSRLLGVRYEADKTSTYWLDPTAAALQKHVDGILPETINLLQGVQSSGEGSILVSSYSDREPGRFFLLAQKTKEIQQIAAARPWIKPAAMSPGRFLMYKARDGMSIPAQLTLPAGAAGRKPPLVVMHYGGPWVRPIHWQWDPNVQFLASRGYAVFMPAPRASTGFGAKLFKGGWKQWGLAMQDDVADGVRALIADGLVDPDRVCIAGASYGGYLTMMGLAKEPDLYKCGINWVGVTDPSFMFTVTWTDFNTVDAARYSLPMLIGDPEKDREQFKRTSPVERAAEIKQPVLMAYGGLDRRVPIVNGERMRSALASHNKKVEWVVYPDEGHGWSRLENNIDFWTRVEKFLAANL